MELSINHISKNYGNKTVVNAFSIELDSGIYGLLGANGAGKTTLMKLITGILKPTVGQIKYNGTEINKLGEDYRDILGYLPQNFGYYPHFKAIDFLMYIASLKGIPHFKAKQKSLELLDLVGLDQERDKKIKTFSGGMRQRLGIAQAMLNDPKILILDEPTAGLDPKERVRFRNLISSVSKDRIIILSTHIVSDVEYIADEIIVMKAGELLLKGSVKQVTHSIAGYVWEGTVTKEEAIKLERKYTVSNLKHDKDMVYIRIVSEKRPFEHAINTVPNLEDLYLHYFRKET
ncbi:ABC-type multidrug transport system, ATPase component [Solibacillus silvestris StLB046]|uniref:ABC-type multidrug transport system, ATPase component n=1 Tax=Solibacillus silvestris (strain StLB046) TaxID=1002809 RepID=F2FAI5_SOLSS|nr:ABC transporter ATP-binding protein [Solibacillus silvestris]BAK16752.1 ABC-type multidrug transport system, ATPase component [Solibacillus silvestris StLB046]